MRIYDEVQWQLTGVGMFTVGPLDGADFLAILQIKSFEEIVEIFLFIWFCVVFIIIFSIYYNRKCINSIWLIQKYL